MKRERKKRKKKNNGENRSIKKVGRHIKRSWAGSRKDSKLNHRKIRRKATKKKTETLEKFKEKARNELAEKQKIIRAKEKWVEELRYLKVKTAKIKVQDGKIREGSGIRES